MILILIQNHDILNHTEIKKIINSEQSSQLKYKARWVIKKYQQKFNFNYFEIFTAVAKSVSYKILLALAVYYSFLVYQMNVKTVFFNESIEKNIYMKMSKKFENQALNQSMWHVICKLNKLLYKLKQISRIWTKVLYNFLRKFDLQKLKTDYCIFAERDLIIVIYVNNLLIIVNDKKVYKNLKSQFKTEFKMTDMSLANHYFDIKLHQNINSIIIKQTEFIKKILH